MRSRRAALGLLAATLLAAACKGGGTVTPSPSHAVSFELREVIFSDIGRDTTHPFTTGVIKRNDPYRQDPNFAEAPPDAAGDLVTFEDVNRDGFYTPGTDAKFLLGPATVIAPDITAATAVQAPAGQNSAPYWSVDFTLDPAGARKLRDLTTALVGKQLAFVLDGLVVSAPKVLSPITSGQGQLTGNFSERSAKAIAAALQPA